MTLKVVEKKCKTEVRTYFEDPWHIRAELEGSTVFLSFLAFLFLLLLGSINNWCLFALNTLAFTKV